jgi:hypothetical protein
MKRQLIYNLLILIFLGSSYQLFAQNVKKDKEKTISLKIQKNENGKKIAVDTTFTLKEGEDLDKILEKYGVKAQTKSKGPGSFDVEIELEDSLEKNGQEMVWVSVDSDEDNVKIHKSEKGKKKKYVIEEDSDIKMIDDDGAKVFIIHEHSGDSSKFTKKIVKEIEIIGDGDEDSTFVIKKIKIKDGKHPKNLKEKKVYKFSSDSLKSENHVFIFTDYDEDELDNFVIEESSDINDSVKIIVKKVKKGDKGKHIVIKSDDKFSWTTDEDVQIISNNENHKFVKLKIDEVPEADLKTLKLSKDYKKLDVEDFMLNLNSDKNKMNLKFNIAEKGNLSVKIFDENGKLISVEELKNFQGKFDKDMDAMKGNLIIQITQNKRHFIRKMMIDF